MVSEFIQGIKVKQNTVANCYIKHDLKPLEAPITVRIKFSKTGSLQFISHLDLQRLWQRALVRAGLPLWYTKGFNPHPKLVFALPLPVGVESVCELIDVRIDKEISCEDIKELLNSVLTNEMRILDVYMPERKFAELAKAEYRIELSSVNATEALAEKINEFFSRDEILMKKHTKSGEKEINISGLIYKLSAKYCTECNKIIIDATIAAGTESLNPEFIISSLRQYGVLPEASLTEEFYSILRERVLDAGDKEYR